MTEPISWIPKIKPVSTKPTRASKTSEGKGASFEKVLTDKQQKYDIKLALEAIRRAPDIRLDKINLARERLKNGFYFSQEATQKIAEKMLEEMGL